MTLKEFILALPTDGWRLLPDGAIRRYRNRTGSQCPISSLAGRNSRFYMDVVYERDVDRCLVSPIVAASDQNDAFLNNRHHPEGVGELRARLLKHLRLT